MGWWDYAPPEGISSTDWANYGRMPEVAVGGWDFGAGDYLGQYDFGRIAPAWGDGSGWSTAGDSPEFLADESGMYAPAWGDNPEFFGDESGSYTFDPTTGELKRGGEPIAGRAFTEDMARQLDEAGGFAGPEGGVFDAAGNFISRAAGGAGRFLGSAAGGTADYLARNPSLARILGATGVGALGLGAQGLFAGGTPKYRPPTYTPSPVTQAGQKALLDALQGSAGPALTEATAAGVLGQRDIARQVADRVGRETGAEIEAAPYERMTRVAALQDVLGLMQPGREQPTIDPVERAIREELLGVMRGGPGAGVSPGTQRRQALDEQDTRARLVRQLGPDYELTTPGIQSLRDMKERHTSEQFTERQATIARLSPLEESRMRFSTVTPTELLGRREGLRRASLGDVERLSRFGIRGTPENVTALGSIVPVQSLLGGDPERANLVNTQLQAGAAQAAFSGESARRANLSRGIGDIAGLVAGTVAARPSAAESYYERLYGGLLNREVNPYG